MRSTTQRWFQPQLWCAAALFLIAGSLCLGSSKADTRNWTVLIYMNGKNSLEGDALDNFHAMAQVGSSADVAFAVEFGRPLKHYTKADGNWSGVYRFLITKGQQPLPSNAVRKVGAADMGKQNVLDDFIQWGKSAYPARHYMLVIWNHGQGYRLQLQATLLAQELGTSVHKSTTSGPLGGFRAVSSDDDFHSIMYNSEVEGALAHNFVRDHLDVLGFDACLMAMMETAYAMAPSANIMVASEELEPGDGWQYQNWMRELTTTPTLSPAELANKLVESYKAGYDDRYFTTMSAVDLTKVRHAAEALSSFADALRHSPAEDMDALRRARAKVSSYGDWYSPSLNTSVDLFGLLAKFEDEKPNAKLISQSKTLRTTLSQLVTANYASSRSAGAEPFYGSNGLAIYFPASKAAFSDDIYHTGYLKTNEDRPVAFVKEQTWADLIYAALGVH